MVNDNRNRLIGSLLFAAAIVISLFAFFATQAGPEAPTAAAQAFVSKNGGQASASTSTTSTVSPPACQKDLKVLWFAGGKVRPNNLATATDEQNDANKARDELVTDRHNEPYLTAQTMGALGWLINNKTETITAKAEYYKSHCDEMATDNQKIDDWMLHANARTEKIPGRYWSYYGMRVNDNTITIHRDGGVDPVEGYRQLILTSGSFELRYSLECQQIIGFEPLPDVIQPAPVLPKGSGGDAPSSKTTNPPPVTKTTPVPPKTTTLPPKSSAPQPTGVTSPGRPNPPSPEPPPTKTQPLQPTSSSATATQAQPPPNQGGGSPGGCVPLPGGGPGC